MAQICGVMGKGVSNRSIISNEAMIAIEIKHIPAVVGQLVVVALLFWVWWDTHSHPTCTCHLVVVVVVVVVVASSEYAEPINSSDLFVSFGRVTHLWGRWGWGPSQKAVDGKHSVPTTNHHLQVAPKKQMDGDKPLDKISTQSQAFFWFSND